MRLDITKLPVGEMLVGFILAMTIVTFVGAFIAVSGDEVEEGSVAASPTPGVTPAATPPAGGATVAVTLGDNLFDPKEITLDAGAAVSFDISNGGAAIHNMRIAGPDGTYNSDDDAVSDPALVAGGQAATLEWQAPSQPGEIIFRCDFHPDVMTGTITLK